MPLPAHLARKLAHQRTEQSAQVSASVEPDVVSTFDFNATPAPAPVPAPVPVEVVSEPVPEPTPAPVEVVPEPVPEPVSAPVEPVSCCVNGTCTNVTCTENCCCKPVEPESENTDEKKNNS